MIEFAIITNYECKPKDYGTEKPKMILALETLVINASVVRDTRIKVFPPFSCSDVCKNGCVKERIIQEIIRRQGITKGSHRHAPSVRIDEGLPNGRKYSEQTIEDYITSLTK